MIAGKRRDDAVFRRAGRKQSSRDRGKLPALEMRPDRADRTPSPSCVPRLHAAWALALGRRLLPPATALLVLPAGYAWAQDQKWGPPIRTVTHLVVRAELLAVRNGGMTRIASATLD